MEVDHLPRLPGGGAFTHNVTRCVNLNASLCGYVMWYQIDVKRHMVLCSGYHECEIANTRLLDHERWRVRAKGDSQEHGDLCSGNCHMPILAFT